MFTGIGSRRTVLAFFALIAAVGSPALGTLTIDLRTPAGSKSAVVSQVGDTIPLELYAQVTGSNTSDSDEQIWSLFGSVLSVNVNDGVIRGDLSVSIVHPFQSINTVNNPPVNIYSNGAAADLDGDGDLDVGSNDTGLSASGYIFARGETSDSPGPFPAPYLGTPIPNGREWKIADVSLHITSILSNPQPGAQTAVNFRWRESLLPILPVAIWKEDGLWYARDQETYLYGTSTVAPGVDISTGSPLLLALAVPEPAAIALFALAPVLLLRRRSLYN